MSKNTKRPLTDLQHEGHGASLAELEQFLMDLSSLSYNQMRDKVASYCIKDLIQSGYILEDYEPSEDIDRRIDGLRLPYTVNNIRYHVRRLFAGKVFAGNKDNGSVGSIRVRANDNSYTLPRIDLERPNLKYYDYEKKVWRFHNVDSLCEFLEVMLRVRQFVDTITLLDSLLFDDGMESHALGLLSEKGVEGTIKDYMKLDSTLNELARYEKEQGIRVSAMPAPAQEVFLKVFACIAIHEDIVSDSTLDYYDELTITHHGFDIEYGFYKDGKLISGAPYSVLKEAYSHLVR